jgi:hypothetical protein
MYVCVCVCACACLFVCVSHVKTIKITVCCHGQGQKGPQRQESAKQVTNTHTHTHTHTHAHTQIQRQAHTDICTYAHTHTHTNTQHQRWVVTRYIYNFINCNFRSSFIATYFYFYLSIYLKKEWHFYAVPFGYVTVDTFFFYLFFLLHARSISLPKGRLRLTFLSPDNFNQ